MTKRLFPIMAVAGLWLALSPGASAQPGSGLAASMIHTPYEGDCAVTIDLPAGVSGDAVQLALDRRDAELIFKIAQGQPFVATLLDPLPVNATLMVTVTRGGAPVSVTVQPRPAGVSPPNACARSTTPRGVYDDRNTFEANGFLGYVFDNFAPAEILGKSYDKPPSGSIDGRWTGGIQAQYRLLGEPDGVRQLWISSETLHGSRTADVDCQKTPSIERCLTANQALVVLEHADTLEAHVEARYEFLRMQKDTDTPVKVFASTRFGFVSMAGAPKVFSSDSYFGGGITTPKGAFRGSFAEVAWGRSRQFQSDPEANRLKVYGTLLFDMAPGLIGQARNVFSHTMASTRAFVAIVVDRNPGGNAPDAVQTYIGVDFDVRRLFGGS
jgi:hypothetical protein